MVKSSDFAAKIVRQTGFDLDLLEQVSSIPPPEHHDNDLIRSSLLPAISVLGTTNCNFTSLHLSGKQSKQ